MLLCFHTSYKWRPAISSAC